MADWFERVSLTGSRVHLVPLGPEHATGWLAGLTGPVAEHLSIGPPADRAGALDQIATALTQADRVPFAQLSPAGEFLGSTSFYDVDPGNRSLAVGYTWLAGTAQRSGVNREAKLLLLTRAFDELGAVRVVWHTDERNARSRAAIAALGAVEEGRLRKHRRRRDGTWRTTVQFAMTEEDWPAAREALTRGLATG